MRSLEAPQNPSGHHPTYRLKDACAVISDLDSLTFATVKELTSDASDSFNGFSCAFVNFKCAQVQYTSIVYTNCNSS